MPHGQNCIAPHGGKAPGFALDVPIDVRRDETGTVVEMDGLFLPAR